MESSLSITPLRVKNPSAEVQALTAVGEGRVGDALTTLMQAYGDSVFRYCYQMLGDRDLAGDVHQTVFVEAYRDLTRFAGRSTLKTWLYAIARHRCLDAAKSRSRWRRLFTSTSQSSCGVALAEAPAPTLAATHARAQRALARLKPKERSAVLLRLVEELSFAEIAAIANERPTTVEARVRRALLKLRAWLTLPGTP